MFHSEPRKLLPYEAPEVDLVKIDVSCSIMQDSIIVPTDTSIPDIEEIEIDWL